MIDWWLVGSLYEFELVIRTASAVLSLPVAIHHVPASQ